MKKEDLVDLLNTHKGLTVCKYKESNLGPITVEKRTFKNYDPERFRDDLHLIPFDIAYIFEDIDDIYWAWSYLLSSLLDDHAPIKLKDVRAKIFQH